jgi:hypothetical protein
MITQQKLKDILHYDQDLGTFTWKVKYNKRMFAGDVAGTLCKGYIKIYIDYVQYKAHQLAWLYIYGEMPKDSIDHINGNNADNRLCNLRLANKFENAANRTIMKNNTSGFKGVTKSRNKWKAQLNFKNIKYNLGIFDTPQLASLAYEKKAKELHGDFYYKHSRKL